MTRYPVLVAFLLLSAVPAAAHDLWLIPPETATPGKPVPVRLTHMARPRAEMYEWESFWTTLTLRLPD
jgi:uncharacterized GH25 family protein